jgi:hypothetical protein
LVVGGKFLQALSCCCFYSLKKNVPSNSILADKKAIILTAVISVLAALRNDPDKQPIIYDGEFEDKRN